MLKSTLDKFVTDAKELVETLKLVLLIETNNFIRLLLLVKVLVRLK
jgi:hypothetical protein